MVPCHGLGGGRWVAFAKLKSGIDQSGLSLPLEVTSLKYTPEFQNSYIRQILPVSLLSRWGDIFLMFLTPPPSPPHQTLRHEGIFEDPEE